MSNFYTNQQGKSSGSFLPWMLVIIISATFAWYVHDNSKNQQAVIDNKQQQLEEPKSQVDKEVTAPKPVVAKTDSNQDVISYHDAVAKAAPSVVNIYTTQKVKQNPYMQDPVLRRFFEFNGGAPKMQEDSTNLGSGVVVAKNGYIVTNAHVVAKADEVVVAFQDGRKELARIIGTDTESDLAVIKVNMTDLTPLSFRDKPIRVGDVALAIGNPFGVGQTVTQGIISATGRTGLGVNTFEDFIQTDAAINPGNSGGALVDAYGNLVGINTMIFSRSGGSMGIGFAIPTVIVEQVMTGLIENGKVSRGWLGIEVQSQLKDPTSLSKSSGVLVMNVLPNSPAEKSGLKVGDIIVNINDKAMTDANALVQYVAKKQPNTTLLTDIKRGESDLQIEITLAERPNQKELSKADDKARNGNGQSNNNQPQNKQQPMSDEDRRRLEQQLLELFK